MLSLHSRLLQTIAIFAFGFVLGGSVLGGLPRQAHAVIGPAAGTHAASGCVSGNAVADFVCRNTWLAHTRHSYR